MLYPRDPKLTQNKPNFFSKNLFKGCKNNKNALETADFCFLPKRGTAWTDYT